MRGSGLFRFQGSKLDFSRWFGRKQVEREEGICLQSMTAGLCIGCKPGPCSYKVTVPETPVPEPEDAPEYTILAVEAQPEALTIVEAPKRKPKKKSTGKSTDVPVGALIPQAHGGALRNGGTNKGGPGRTPDEFKAMMAQLASADERRKVLEDILSDPAHQHFLGAMKLAAAYGYGQPKETKEVSGSVTVKHQVWKFGDKKVEF